MSGSDKLREACALALRCCQDGDAFAAAHVLHAAILEHDKERAALAEMDEMVEHHKRAAERRGWLTGHINQTDAWFRDERTPEERIGGGA